jgi:hypothetical protein
MRVMGDWLLALPLPWMTLVIFAAAYLVAAGVYLVVVGLAVNGLARVFKAFSPQMLTPLGVIFGLIVGFVAVQTWNDPSCLMLLSSHRLLFGPQGAPHAWQRCSKEGSCPAIWEGA